MRGNVRLDWKYVVMLAIAVAGVLVPIWLAKYQSPDKGIVVRVVSQSALQPAAKDVVPGLQVLVDGAVLSDPYLSVIQIVNEGDKPISATDFEGSLEIHMNPNLSIVRARVSEKSPDDIQVDVSWEKQMARMKPTLLNPKDSITIAILSSGGMPTFVAQARIKGISSVPVLKPPEKHDAMPLAVYVFFLVSAFFFAVTSLAAYWRWPLFARPGMLVSLRPRTVFAISAVLQFGAIGMLMVLLRILEVNSFWVAMGAVALLLTVAVPVARWLEAHPSNAGNSYNS